MNELDYLIDIFKPYIKFEKTTENNPDLTSYEGHIDKELHIEIVITHHIQPSITFNITDALIHISYDKFQNRTYVTIVINQGITKYSAIVFDMDTVKEILVETHEEFEKRILE
jgi:hypothetical protein